MIPADVGDFVLWFLLPFAIGAIIGFCERE